jgi:DNA polymerase-3 subunit alpha
MIRGIGEIPEAISNTLKIAERVDLNLKFGEVHLPEYAVPPETTREAYLSEHARAGLADRLSRSTGVIPQADYEARLARELLVINAMGYAGYFLIVWDIIRYAREHRIPVGPGRGSAAGSLVAYALAITDIDPIPHGLLFERFLNPERISLPDIDMDFCMDRREEVIRYVTQKYGADHVAQIITFGTMAAKAALRDVGRVMEMPYANADRLAKLVPYTLHVTLDEAIEKEPKLAQAAADDPQVREVLSLARQLEGLTRHASTHAAGVVISSAPLTDHVPLYRGSRGEIVTQYAMEDLEQVGLIKFDFLGLRTLTVIDQAVRFINQRQPDGLAMATLPLDDRETYALLGSGETVGLFQLESRGMRDLLVSMQPETFEDIVALLALYRPGPIGSGMIDDFIKRKRGQTKIVYELPQLEPILSATYGVIVYQEQVMQVAHVLANFSLGEADILRRAMGKKKPEEMAAQKTLFVERAGKNNVTRVKAEKIFDLLEYFAGYGFNKSHSAAYALITYQTAYLKRHHPVEFMAAILSSEMGNSDKIVPYLSECRRMGIRILPPDVNESDKGFAVVAEGIRFGLAAIKNVGVAAIDVILAERQKGGRFPSLFNFCRRVDSRKCNRRVMESLIQCGAFDSTGAARAALAESLDAMVQAGGAAQKRAESGQISMFGGEGGEEEAPPLATVPEWDDLQRSKFEKELTGFYITTHPLARHEAFLKKAAVTPIAQFSEPDEEAAEGETERVNTRGDEAEVRICGMVISQKVATTRRGDKMAYLRVEDLTGAMEVIVFPDLYATAAPLIQQENPLLIFGTVESGERGTKMKATALRLFPGSPKRPEGSDDERTPLTTGATRATGTTGDTKSKTTIGHHEEAVPLILRVSAETIGPSDLHDLKTLLQRYPGRSPVRLILCTSTSETTLAVDDRLRVERSDALREALTHRFGTGVSL